MWDYWRTHIRGCSSTVGLFALQGWQQYLWWVNGRRWKGQSKTVRSLWAVFRSNTVNVIKPTPWYNTVFRFHEAEFFYSCDYESFTRKIAYKDTPNLTAGIHQAGLYRIVLCLVDVAYFLKIDAVVVFSYNDNNATHRFDQWPNSCKFIKRSRIVDPIVSEPTVCPVTSLRRNGETSSMSSSRNSARCCLATPGRWTSPPSCRKASTSCVNTKVRALYNPHLTSCFDHLKWWTHVYI